MSRHKSIIQTKGPLYGLMVRTPYILSISCTPIGAYRTQLTRLGKTVRHRSEYLPIAFRGSHLKYNIGTYWPIGMADTVQ